MLIKTKYSGYATDGARTYPKGGDGGAGEMRRQEEERQARINAAVDAINGIFDARPTTKGVNAATSFDPNATYFNADGSRWSTPTRPEIAGYEHVNDEFGGGWVPVTQDTTDHDAINHAVQSGQLFTGTHTTQPQSRDTLYAEHKQAVTDLNRQDVDKQFKQAERAARFGLARSGLMGGSEDIDVRSDLVERQNKGLMQASALGDAAAAELKTQDERARQSLISMAQSGIDTGTAQSMAMKQLDAAAQAAKGDRTAATVGDLFGDMSNAYLLQRQRAGMNAGAQQYGNGGFGSGNVRAGDAGTINR